MLDIINESCEEKKKRRLSRGGGGLYIVHLLGSKSQLIIGQKNPNMASEVTGSMGCKRCQGARMQLQQGLHLWLREAPPGDSWPSGPLFSQHANTISSFFWLFSSISILIVLPRGATNAQARKSIFFFSKHTYTSEQFFFIYLANNQSWFWYQ